MESLSFAIFLDVKYKIKCEQVQWTYYHLCAQKWNCTRERKKSDDVSKKKLMITKPNNNDSTRCYNSTIYFPFIFICGWRLRALGGGSKKNTHISPTGKMVSLEICIQLGSVRFGSVQTWMNHSKRMRFCHRQTHLLIIHIAEFSTLFLPFFRNELCKRTISLFVVSFFSNCFFFSPFLRKFGNWFSLYSL